MVSVVSAGAKAIVCLPKTNDFPSFVPDCFLQTLEKLISRFEDAQYR